uniref:Uncharacterized protein n=1 Tax=Amphiprion percula TaxID=161767 RepID=A0A3P8TGX9_AMPPE
MVLQQVRGIISCTNVFIRTVCQHIIMPEDKNCKLLQPARICEQKQKKKKKRKKTSVSTADSDQRSKKHLKDSQESGSGAPVQGYVTELSVQARESLRWEGALQDPQAEAKRLEQYRANRRQRYIAHREALLKETQDALRQTFPKESNEENLNALCRICHKKVSVKGTNPLI